MDYFLSALQTQMWLPYVINLNLDKFQIRFLEAWRDRDNEKKFWNKNKNCIQRKGFAGKCKQVSTEMQAAHNVVSEFYSPCLTKSQSRISSHRKLSLKNPPGVPRTSKMARHTKGRRDRCYAFAGSCRESLTIGWRAGIKDAEKFGVRGEKPASPIA